MQTIDLEMTKDLSDALFNPQESSLLRDSSRAGLLGYGSGRASVSERRSLVEQIESFPNALKAAELAELLSVSRITIFKLAKSGRIPSFRVGTCVRFDRRTVAKWLRSM